jgi:hypothetical protein
MSSQESVWSIAPIGLLLVGFLLFSAHRRRTAYFHESRAFKARLPRAVARVERFAFYISTLTIAAVVFAGFSAIFSGSGSARKIAGATAVYACIGAWLIAAPVGALLANLVSATVPSLRSANLSAMAGTRVSFATANRGLLIFSAVTIPLGVIALTLGIVEPWRQ